MSLLYLCEGLVVFVVFFFFSTVQLLNYLHALFESHVIISPLIISVIEITSSVKPQGEKTKVSKTTFKGDISAVSIGYHLSSNLTH